MIQWTKPGDSSFFGEYFTVGIAQETLVTYTFSEREEKEKTIRNV